MTISPATEEKEKMSLSRVLIVFPSPTSRKGGPLTKRGPFRVGGAPVEGIRCKNSKGKKGKRGNEVPPCPDGRADEKKRSPTQRNIKYSRWDIHEKGLPGDAVARENEKHGLNLLEEGKGKNFARLSQISGDKRRAQDQGGDENGTLA